MVTQEELNQWEQRTIRLNAHLLKALRALQQGDTGMATHHVSAAQELTAESRTALLEAGAVDSVQGRANAFLADHTK